MSGVYLLWGADVARRAVVGTPYRVIEVAGWQTRGHGGYRAVEGIVGHHTGGPKAGDYPSLNIVVNGRADLAGPLCTYGLARSGDIYVVAAGVAWHAGASAWDGMVDLNDEFAGVEAESAGAGDWTPAQLDCYPRLVGAFLAQIRRGSNRYVSHRTCALPAGRKPDPTGIDDAWMRQAATPYILGTPASTTAKDEPVADIPLTMSSDGSFRGYAMCEAGADSIGVARAFITFGVLWGGNATFVITPLAKGGPMAPQVKRVLNDNQDDSYEVPSGCRMVTIEGKASSPNVAVVAARVAIPR